MDREDKFVIIWWVITGLLMVGFLIGVMYALTMLAMEI